MSIFVVGIALILLVVVLVLLVLEPLLIGLTVIKPNMVGVVEKWWSFKGSAKDGSYIVLNGEAGFQPDVLRAGIHFKPRIIYKIHISPIVSIPQGEMGYVFARDGKALEEGQRLARKVECNNYQDFKAFIKAGGQKGTQISILREGLYAINTAAFIVLTSTTTYTIKMNDKDKNEIQSINQSLKELNGFKPVVLDGKEDKLGIVTVLEGPSLDGEIIAPIVGADPKAENYHNCFQDPTKFLVGGGYAGRQLQVLTEGCYYINRKFATIEYIAKTEVPISYVGVINSFVGKEGKDESGTDYKHGQLVAEGCKGVWNKVYGPGKYALNTYAQKLSQVPTHNFILKWQENEAGSHNFDQNLASINLITKDAYQPTLPLSVVVNIAYNKAPRVIQRFGDIKKLVEQTLDPMVAAYFKNTAQNLSLIELIQKRTDIQEKATADMKEKFNNYDLELVEVLIGTPASNGDKKIEEILNQLSERQLSAEKQTTYQAQMEAAVKEKELNEVKAKAQQQTQLTESSIQIEIQNNKSLAELRKAEQEAKKIETLAKADALKIQTLARADAERKKMLAEADAYEIEKTATATAKKITQEGMAQAVATREQVNAFGGPQYQLMQLLGEKFCKAVQESGIDLVPKQMINMGGDAQNNNAFSAFMSVLLSQKLGVTLDDEVEESKEVKAFKETILGEQEERKAKDEAATTRPHA